MLWRRFTIVGDQDSANTSHLRVSFVPPAERVSQTRLLRAAINGCSEKRRGEHTVMPIHHHTGLDIQDEDAAVVTKSLEPEPLPGLSNQVSGNVPSSESEHPYS